MEDVKQWYLHNLLLRLNINMKTLIQGIDNVVKRARRFYAQPLDHISQNDFIEMMILDACFLIELFRKLCFPENKLSCTGSVPLVQETDTGNDPILNMDCMLQYLCHDLSLLENQLPWFVLQCLYNLTAYNSPHPCLTLLVLKFFS
ncbi:hypothetical protein RchiOBHm_Chr7g0185591 [Rosa chinensis]|uniref:Uncharacterized protein n=1 Tax=Rosa chinensis TaxID=74649 RepID=A0A2P6P3Q4_ROSCH|nr:hypothetical protein RchiOBHm_Chr7g0185591 [Rosa chinensis]